MENDHRATKIWKPKACHYVVFMKNECGCRERGRREGGGGEKRLTGIVG